MLPSEDELIARYFAPLAGPAGLGLRDDAGLVAVPAGFELVVTKDAVVAGVHLFDDDPPDAIARKALGVNLSDLAAKAAEPLGFLLAIALPQGWTEDWLAAFAAGLGAAAGEHGCPLIGGDTVATAGPLLLSVTALGLVPQGGMLRRTGARPGDRIYVSGSIGDGALGLAVRQAERGGASPPWIAALDEPSRRALRDRYWSPVPRLALRAALAEASGGMDVSDGLVGDLAKMLRVSGVSGRLDAARLPLSGAASAAVGLDPRLRDTILTGGDDYEVLASVPADRALAYEAAAAAAGVPVTWIGEVLPGTAPLVVVDARGAPLRFRRSSFSHT